jgi:chemotaxis protein histidine kinase CheA
MQGFLNDNFELLQLGYGGNCKKTFVLHEKDLDILKSVVSLGDISTVSQNIERWINEIQMEKLGEVLDCTKKSILDLAAKMGKKVEFVILSPELRIDTHLLGGLIKSLIHIYRNAIDHGIEFPEERVAKSTTAKIETQMIESEDGWRLVVTDDGRGISAGKLVEKSIAKGIITVAESMTLSQVDKLMLIFNEGVSTAEQVTQISGRGVGLSALARVVQDLNGTIHVESRPNMGTKFEFSIPKMNKVTLVRSYAKAC